MDKALKALKENILLSMTVFTGITVAVSHKLGLLSDSQILSSILVILTLITTAEVIERRRTRAMQERIEKELPDKIIQALKGIETHFVYDRKSLYSYLEYRIKDAKNSWDILTFGSYKPTEDRPEDKKGYQQETEEAVKKRNLIVRRTSMIWSREHFDHLIERMKRYEGFRYHVGCLPPMTPIFPLFDMIIIDKREVVLWKFYDMSFAGWDAGGFSIKSESFAKLCADYYSMVWNQAVRVKDSVIDYSKIKSFGKYLARN